MAPPSGADRIASQFNAILASMSKRDVTPEPAISGYPDGFAVSNPGIPFQPPIASPSPAPSAPQSTLRSMDLGSAGASVPITPSSSPAAPTPSPAATTSATPSLAATTANAIAPSAAARSGTSPSSKIGIGLGVPFALLVLAIIGFLAFRWIRRRRGATGINDARTTTPELYPTFVQDEKSEHAENSKPGMVPQKDEDENGLQDNVHEIHGTEIPPYTRELPGSPGVRRHELSARRGSV